jgi:hypothetical protein
MKTVKLVIPVTVTLVRIEENESSPNTPLQNSWTRSFPRCPHEKENIVESWQVLEILLVIVTNHCDQTVTACYYSNQNIYEQFVLAANSIFSAIKEDEPEPVDYDYFTEQYKKHVWLIVYCRKCSTIFQACGL